MKKNNDSKTQVLWCLKQNRGIKIEEPNDNLCKVYIKKARSSLNMLNSAQEKNEIEWISTTAYYARYFVFYALLQKCGIKSEIHECTISLAHFVFVEKKLIEKYLYEELEESKELRIETQYYVVDQINLKKLKEHSEKSRNFVLKIEEVIENLNEEEIRNIRKELQDL